MQIMKVDPRALKENPDRMRQSKSSPQADALMLATIKASRYRSATCCRTGNGWRKQVLN